MNIKCYYSVLLLIQLFLINSINALASDSINVNNNSFFSFDEQIVNGTTGTPLGGFGCGAIKFDANTGTFSAMTVPPADAYDFKNVADAQFQLFTNRNGQIETRNILKAILTHGRPNDDAIWPLHKVDFGSVNGVRIELTGISPLDNKDNNNSPIYLI